MCYCSVMLPFFVVCSRGDVLGFLKMRSRLTWAFLDAEGPIGVLGSGVVLQLERCGVVDKRLRALGHTRSAVVEIGASLQ